MLVLHGPGCAEGPPRAGRPPPPPPDALSVRPPATPQLPLQPTGPRGASLGLSDSTRQARSLHTENKYPLPCRERASISSPAQGPQEGGPTRHSCSGDRSVRVLSEPHLPVCTEVGIGWLNSGSFLSIPLPQDRLLPEDILLPKPTPGDWEQAAGAAPTPGGQRKPESGLLPEEHLSQSHTAHQSKDAPRAAGHIQGFPPRAHTAPSGVGLAFR